MEKIDVFTKVMAAIAMLGVLVFWIAGFKDKDTLAACALVTGGVSAGIFLITKGICALRNRNMN
jgi:hypothetical protein